jgi:hypothetical protein
MFDWLKTIIGDSYTEEIDKKVSTEIGKLFVSKENYDKLNGDKKELEKQVAADKKTHEEAIAERDKQLEELKKADPAALQAKITELQTANTTAKEEYEKNLKATQLSSKLELRLIKEGAVNTKAVMALLDNSKISLDGENLVGVDDQLRTLKETEKWAFGAPVKTGMGQGGAGGETTLADEIKSKLYGEKKT